MARRAGDPASGADRGGAPLFGFAVESPYPMIFRLIPLLAAALVALAPAAWAQTETAPADTAPPAATPAPDAAPPAEGAPATDAPAADGTPNPDFPVAAQEQPRETVKGTFEDWQVRCSTREPEKCFLYQVVSDDQKQAIAEFTMIALPEGSQAAAGATLVTPLGVLLGKGVSLTIDNAQPLGYPYLYCAQSGCFARLGLTAATITRMKRGNVAKLTIFGVNAPEKAVIGNLSLKGFTAAMKEIGG